MKVNNKIPVKKNEKYIVNIIDNGFEGEGIAKVDNFTIFVNGAIKGEKVEILIVKVLSSHAYGKIIEILESSPMRHDVDCSTYKRCGGCNLRHIKYDDTLLLKQNIIQNLVNKELKTKIKVENTLGMENPFYYRNKLQFPVGLNKENKKVYGIFANRTHEIIENDNCLIQNQEAQKIAKDIFIFLNENNISVYNEKENKGLIRHIVIKVGIRTNKIMCILVINGKEIPKENELIKCLTKKYPEIKTIVKNINTKNTNVILGKENIVIYGDGYIDDILGEYKFNISPLSFYQVNPIQAEQLYNIAIENANITKNDIVFDLYCGIGTISIFMSKYAKKVYGVEIVEDAIKDAKENAKINNIKNTEFIAGDAEIVFDDLINNKKIVSNVLVCDPPRKGIDNKTIENIRKIHPERFIYISCNPATLIRDLSKLEDIYEIKKIKPIDMFPYTNHVETIALLILKN